MTEEITEMLIKSVLEHGVTLNTLGNLTADDWEQKKVDDYNSSPGGLNLVDGFNCAECKNRGYIGSLRDGFFVHKECRCMEARRNIRRAQKSGLGTVLASYTFENFKTSNDWQANMKHLAQAFIEDDAYNWFFIGGQVGCGKTHICTAICGELIKRGKDCHYMMWSEESKRLKAVANNGEAYGEKMDVLKSVDVLYIDDFLKTKSGENPTAADINIAFEILNRRLMDRSLVTVISSERTLPELMETDEATISRIYQRTGVYKISIGKDVAKNYRLKEG